MNQRKRVLIIDNVAVESAKRSLYRELAKRGELEVILLLPGSWKEQGEAMPCEKEPTEFIRVRTTRILFGYRQHRVLYRGLFRELRNIRPQFLYIDTEPENYAAVQCLAATSLLYPHPKLGLVSSRNLDYGSVGFPYKFALSHRLCDATLKKRKADVIFVRPESGFHYMEPYAKRVYDLPQVVDCSVFRKIDHGDEGARDGSLVVGFLGRLIESKGIHLLIEALPFLPAHVRLLIVGQGPMLATLKQLAEHHRVADRVRFHRAVEYKDVPHMLNTIDVLALPSLDSQRWVEQFGRVLIEAMACEVPIVASQSGEIPRVVGTAGLLFRMGDRRDLIEKLTVLATNKDLRAMLAEKGRSRAVECFDSPVVANKLAFAIRDTLDQHT